MTPKVKLRYFNLFGGKVAEQYLAETCFSQTSGNPDNWYIQTPRIQFRINNDVEDNGVVFVNKNNAGVVMLIIEDDYLFDTNVKGTTTFSKGGTDTFEGAYPESIQKELRITSRVDGYKQMTFEVGTWTGTEGEVTIEFFAAIHS